MTDCRVSGYEAEDIKVQVARILGDLGHPEPPLRLEDVRELLRLDLRYYNTADPSTLDGIAHRLRVAGKQVLARPALILDVIKAARLSALWVPDRKRILLDEALPAPKKRWAEAHELGHSIIPWHGGFLFGDTDQTLDPACHAQVEAEANFAAAQLLFMQDQFIHDARDSDLSWNSIKALGKRYGNSMTTVFWRMIEDRDPQLPSVGIIGQHPRYPMRTGSPTLQVKHFIRSQSFVERFSNLTSSDIYAAVSSYVSFSKRGPLGDAVISLLDNMDGLHKFEFSSFSNSHDVLSFGIMRSH